MDTKQNAYAQENEQKRQQWREEVQQVRKEEEQKYFHIEKKILPFIALVVPCCFVVYFFYGTVSLYSSGRWFWLLWTGSIVVMLRYSYKLNHLVDKFCIGLLLCNIAALIFYALGNAHLLVGSMAQACVVLYKIACIAGVVYSIYPIKVFWAKRNEIKDMEVTNPWS